MENRLKDSVPPHNIEAEQATLGAMLLDWDAVGTVLLILHASDFYTQQNQTVFEGLSLLSRKGVQGDTLTLIGELTKNGKLEQAGGAGYIASLTNVVPTSANVEYYAKIVKDLSVRRSLIRISADVKAEAFDETIDSKSILDSAEKRIFAIAELDQSTPIHTMLDVIPKSLETIQYHYQHHDIFTGIPSGFAKLDSMTSGFQNSELIIIGARPSMGKTALALNMMEHIALERKIPCGFFSLEMSSEQIGQRILSQVGHVPGTKLRDGTMKFDELQKLQLAASKCYNAPLYIIDTPNMQLIELRAMARRLRQNNNVQIIFIDYIGLITVENSQAAVYEQVSEISKSLKSLARELNIPIVALCQVSRDAEGNEPNLSQLRGSGSIEQDADVVMFIHRERKKQEDGQMMPVQDAKLIVAKQRNGPIGDVNLLFLSAFTRFENKTMDGESAPLQSNGNASFPPVENGFAPAADPSSPGEEFAPMPTVPVV